MRVAVTADVHLAPGSAHPERLDALQSLFLRLSAEGIADLVIAGDLFDAETRDYSGFEEICRLHPLIRKHVIPGNHDPGINGRNLSCPCVSVYTEPEPVEIGGIPFLLVPYREGVEMGSVLAEATDDLRSERWVLVGHGDLHGGPAQVNPYERGTYMPLSLQDVRRYTPWRVFLGHIHKPVDQGRVHYPGSPCGLDVTEQGRRRFLVLDTETGEVESRTVPTAVLHFAEEFVVLPGEDEITRLERDAAARVEAWGLSADERDRVRVRISARGYSSDRSRVGAVLEAAFRGIPTYRGEPIDLSGLLASDDARLNAVAERARRFLEETDWRWGGEGPEPSAVREEILRLVYGRGGS